MTNLRVALLALGKPNGFAGRGQDRVGPLLPERIPVGLFRRGDRIPEGIGAVSPSIDDDEHQGASRRRGHADLTASAAARTISVKSACFRLAPPTNAPSISGFSISVAAFAGVTLPP